MKISPAQEPQTGEAVVLPVTGTALAPVGERVVISGFDIPFGNLLVILIELSVALVIVGTILAVVWALVGSFFVGLLGSL